MEGLTRPQVNYNSKFSISEFYKDSFTIHNKSVHALMVGINYGDFTGQEHNTARTSEAVSF